MKYIKPFNNHNILENKVIDKDKFIVYEFTIDDVDFFVRFYERTPNIWRRGYWFKEKNYYSSNIEKINKRLKTETDNRIIDRLKNELEYFTNNIHYEEKDLIGKSKSPLKIIDSVSNITIDFLKEFESKCDCLEIHHMRTSREEVSTRLKLTKRSIISKLDFSIWNYKTVKSTSLIFKKDLDFNNLSLEIY